MQKRCIGDPVKNTHLNHSLVSVYCRYDPVGNRWRKLADMQEARCLFSMVVLDGMIYAIGGEKTYKVSVDSVERYSPNTNSWR